VTPIEELVALSQWIDRNNDHKPLQQQDWERTAKVCEEAGEVIAAMIGVTGQNPRKGVTHTVHDVIEELLDVVVTGLGAIEHLTGHSGVSLDLLDDKIHRVALRAGVTDTDRSAE
jgi:NTP pyrophosphatase (non-canonical NTP hydrolase)